MSFGQWNINKHKYTHSHPHHSRRRPNKQPITKETNWHKTIISYERTHINIHVILANFVINQLRTAACHWTECLWCVRCIHRAECETTLMSQWQDAYKAFLYASLTVNAWVTYRLGNRLPNYSPCWCDGVLLCGNEKGNYSCSRGVWGLKCMWFWRKLYMCEYWMRTGEITDLRGSKAHIESRVLWRGRNHMMRAV